MDRLKDCTLDNTTDLFEMGSELIPAKLLANYDGDTGHGYVYTGGTKQT